MSERVADVAAAVRSIDGRVVGCQFERGVTAGDDVDALRPFVGFALERDRLIGLHGITPGTQRDVGSTSQRGERASRWRSWRLFADEQRVACHRRDLAGAVRQRDRDVERAQRLGKRRRRAEKPTTSQRAARDP